MKTNAKSYLRFSIGMQDYALPVRNVIEVLYLVKVTPVPEQPPDHLGVMTLRGQIIPVIDLRRRFTGSSGALTLSTPIIAIHHEGKRVALVVDAVDDVVEIAGEMEAFPEPAIESIVRLDNQIIMLPDVARLVAAYQNA